MHEKPLKVPARLCEKTLRPQFPCSFHLERPLSTISSLGFRTHLLLPNPYDLHGSLIQGHFLKVFLVPGKSLSFCCRFQTAIRDPKSSPELTRSHLTFVSTARASVPLSTHSLATPTCKCLYSHSLEGIAAKKHRMGMHQPTA